MNNSIILPGTLERAIAGYNRDAASNDELWRMFSERTNEVPLLRDHRNWIEEHRLGFGDRAFHYMWLILLDDVVRRRSALNLLEIGVYKGQILSLWALIAKSFGTRASIVGITPLKGKPPVPRVFHRIRMAFDRVYRQDAIVGNLHHNSNYRDDIDLVLRHFDVADEGVALIAGYSQDHDVWSQVKDRSFDVVYIDGGHRYEEVSADLRLYSPTVSPGGYLVVDDAGFFEPGSVFFKGFEAVSRAVNELDAKQWLNVLNVGHNRVFRKLGEGA